MFSHIEIRQLLIESIRFYNEKPRNVLIPSVQNEMSESCIRKLMNYSAATLFTRKEYTLMYIALCFVTDLSYDTGEDIGYNTEPLIDRLAKLSGL